MKRYLLLAITVLTLGNSVGCCLLDRVFCARPRHYSVCPDGACGQRGCRDCGPMASRRAARNAYYPGEPTGTVAYPYYTNRGPRDFLARDPGSIGPQ